MEKLSHETSNKKNLTHKNISWGMDESGMGFSTKKEQVLNPFGFKTLPAHHDTGLGLSHFGQHPKSSLDLKRRDVAGKTALR